LAMGGSFVSNTSILLMSVAIFASAATDDSIDKRLPLEVMNCESQDFFGAWLPLDGFLG